MLTVLVFPERLMQAVEGGVLRTVVDFISHLPMWCQGVKNQFKFQRQNVKGYEFSTPRKVQLLTPTCKNVDFFAHVSRMAPTG